MSSTGWFKSTRRPLGHAVVCGGSVAGLLAARVAAGHFDRVTLVERDRLTGTPGTRRKGVPQGDHLHLLLVRGRMILETLFPGLTTDLMASGACLVDSGRSFRWHQGGGWRMGHDSPLWLVSASRPLLETAIAARVRALPNVTIRDGTTVAGFVPAPDGVAGVRLASAGTDTPKDLPADLVIDATGRGSIVPRWLDALDWPVPAAERFGARIAYATCLLPRPRPGPAWRALAVTGTPAPRSAALFPIEGGVWQLTLAGFFDQPMPVDHGGILDFLGRLGVSDLTDAVSGLVPTTPVTAYRFAGSRRHRYDRLPRVPAGLVVLGDALCSFNPVYGQGMTVAALQAEILDRRLARASRCGGLGPGFGRRWFKAVAPVLDAACAGVTVEDTRYPELARQAGWRTRLLRWYMERLHRRTLDDASVTDQFYRVTHFVDPPSRLCQPRIAAAVLCRAGDRFDAPDSESVHGRRHQ